MTTSLSTNDSYNMNSSKSNFLIVGIGASAGGVGALQKFFEQVPADSGIAYVVVLHLSPDHDSQLAQVLQTVTTIPVTKVMEREEVKINQVYVISPNQHLTMQDGHIIVSPNLSIEDRRAPVDIFFRTLAESHRSRAVCVVLSGTGANGSMGLKRIKERGGAAFVQSPREAEFSEMPRNSIATELVDEVLNVADIPAKIIAYRDSLGTVQIAEDAEKQPRDQQQALREIFNELRLRTGHDFTNYKRPTLLRRIERRINIHNLPDLNSYVSYINQNTEEVTALLKDLLISVTNFFRDKKAFEAIENEVLPVLLKGKTRENQLRIWVAGCATGEEAYSLAMLAAEKAADMADAPKIQIFATDIDENAITQARDGCYTINDLADVPPERLRRFFIKEGDDFRIRREIRETVLFANHNFLKDPPFSHLDLVSCRNVMIYLNHIAQERVVETFHFALNPGAFLFLGSSESVDGATDLYASYNRESHIFQTRQASVKMYPVPESIPHFRAEPQQFSTISPAQENKVLERISFGDLHQQLLENYAPPSLVVNEEYDIVHLSEKVGKYLQIAGGEVSQNILKLIRPELRLELRSALYGASQGQSAVEARGLKLTIDNKTEIINIHARPVLRTGDTAKGFILVLFEPTVDTGKPEIVVTSDGSVARQLEEELIKLKAQLRSSNEQHDFQAEELKASNEELQAMNEELRSAAEELETSKEELQSINEELRTVNQELKVKVDESRHISNNLQNLINSTNIATIFLDRSLRVSLFTPSIKDLFNLITGDFGRPITDITNRLNYNNLVSDAESVLETLSVLEREVTTTDNRAYIMRLLPYRTSEDRINGVVITFYDVTQRIAQQEALRKSEEKYRSLFTSIDDGFCVMERVTGNSGDPLDFRYLEANAAFTQQSGVTHVIGKTIRQILPGIDEDWFRIYNQVIETGQAVRFEKELAETGRILELYAFPVDSEASNQLAVIFKDITARKQQEANLAFLAEMSQDLVRLTNIDETMNASGAKIATYFGLSACVFAEQEFKDGVQFSYINHGWHRADTPSLLGTYRMREFMTQEMIDMCYAGEDIVIRDVFADPKTDGAQYKAINVGSFVGIPLVRNGDWRFLLVVYRSESYNWRDDQVELLRELMNRIWARLERARSEEALRESEERMRLAIAAAKIYSWEYDIKTGFYSFSDNAAEILGVEELPRTAEDNIKLVHPDDKNLIDEKLKTAVNEARGFALDFRSVKENGDLVWLSVQTAMTTDATGKANRLIGIAQDVSSRKEADEDLRESEERYRAFFSQATAGVSELDLEGNIILANNTFCDILGYTQEEILGMNIRHFTHPDSLPVCLDFFERTIKTRQSFTIEKKLICKNGLNIWVTESTTPTLDETGNIKSVLAVGIEITERKIAEMLVHDSEERFRIALEAGELATWDWNLTTNEVQWNDQHFKLFGVVHDSDTIEPEYFLSFIYPEDLAYVKNELMQVLGEKGIYTAEFRIRRRDNGKLRWMSGYGRVTEREENGKPLRVSGVMFDSTERRVAEENLQATQNSLNTALEAAKMGVWTMDMVHGYFDRSAKHDQLLGFQSRQEEWNTNKAKTHIIDEDKPKYDVAYNNLVTKGIFELEARVKQSDGNICWVYYYGRAFEGDDGKNDQAAGVIFDISDRKTIEKQKDEFIGIASHELKTPVTSIKAYAEILQEMFNENKDYVSASLMEKLDGQVNRLTNLIKDLLDVTKITEGQLQLTRKSFSIADMTKNMAEEMQRTTRQHTIKLNLTSLPLVIGDEERLGQVLTNLLSNAIKYSPESKEVMLKAKFEEGKIYISVQDFGIGMSPGTKDKLFARFFRSDNPSVRSYPGLGLGLFISMEIMKRHNGTISVQSEKGKGSTFTMILPANF